MKTKKMSSKRKITETFTSKKKSKTEKVSPLSENSQNEERVHEFSSTPVPTHAPVETKEEEVENQSLSSTTTTTDSRDSVSEGGNSTLREMDDPESELTIKLGIVNRLIEAYGLARWNDVEASNISDLLNVEDSLRDLRDGRATFVGLSAPTPTAAPAPTPTPTPPVPTPGLTAPLAEEEEEVAPTTIIAPATTGGTVSTQDEADLDVEVAQSAATGTQTSDLILCPELVELVTDQSLGVILQNTTTNLTSRPRHVDTMQRQLRRAFVVLRLRRGVWRNRYRRFCDVFDFPLNRAWWMSLSRSIRVVKDSFVWLPQQQPDGVDAHTIGFVCDVNSMNCSRCHSVPLKLLGDLDVVRASDSTLVNESTQVKILMIAYQHHRREMTDEFAELVIENSEMASWYLLEPFNDDNGGLGTLWVLDIDEMEWKECHLP